MGYVIDLLLGERCYNFVIGVVWIIVLTMILCAVYPICLLVVISDAIER
jgi:hypothetical protein